MRVLSTKYGRLVNGLGQLLFPPACLFCQARLPDSGSCCAACHAAIEVLGRDCCRRCGEALPASMAPGPCGGCLKSPPAQCETVSLYAYRGPVREAILAWKLAGDDAAARWLLAVAAGRLCEHIAPEDWLLPVPMPLSRMRKSGLHHAAALCRMVAEATGCRWDWRLLRRHGEQPRQSELSGHARRRNLRKAFAANRDYMGVVQERMAPGGRIWVVDDILTTGATLHHAAKAASAIGRPVHALSLARTPKR